MAYIKLDANGVVVYKTPYYEADTIEAPDWVTCGYVKSGVTYVVPITPLETRQASAWQAIKAKRELVQYGGVLVGTKWFHTDESSRALYNTLLATAVEKALLGTDVIAANWKTMDGTFVSMTVDLLRQIRDVGMTAVTTNFTNTETHRIAMLASATPETYNFSTGWTVVYPV